MLSRVPKPSLSPRSSTNRVPTSNRASSTGSASFPIRKSSTTSGSCRIRRSSAPREPSWNPRRSARPWFARPNRRLCRFHPRRSIAASRRAPDSPRVRPARRVTLFVAPRVARNTHRTGFRVPARSCKSRELRGGVLIANCECLKRNGLQHDCPRSECQGKSCCLTKPEATCCPSTWARRFRFVTMGNKSNPVCPKRCRVTTTGSGCNPCGVDCFSCPPCGPCGPCPVPCEPCGPCGPVCDPSCPPVCDPCGCVPQGDCGPCGAPTPNCMPCYDPCTPSVPPPCGDMCAPYPTCGPC